ncbi:hypothetical protein [Streptomyces sp. NPDC050485]|uniref:hypothetical protein n=1 Tax=Streptomyces sp. NPDC050485 TaxID=3365617 RepID=UPI0037A2B6C3
MRARTPRRLAAVALSTAIVIGSAGTAMAAESHSPSSVRAEVPVPGGDVPVPGADALLAQVNSLGDMGGVLTPVTDLLNAVLKADNGQLPAADAEALLAKATAALDKVKSAPLAVPATPSVPSTSALPAVPATPSVPSTSALPAAPKLPAGSPQNAAALLDLKADAVAALKKALGALVKDVTSLNVAGVVPDATAVITGLVGVVVATVLGGGLPVPNLPGLPALPKLPV